METGFVKVGDTSQIPLSSMKLYQINNQAILVCNVNGAFFAINGKCTHMGGDLSKGSLEGNIVTCPRHHSRFDVTTGKVVSHPKIPLIHPKIKDEQTYEVKIENGSVMLKL